jgi:hypothetical protein
VSQVLFSVIPSDRCPLGGRLRHFLPFWRRETSNPTILNTVMGVHIPFLATPVQKVPVRPYSFKGPDKAEVQRELSWMLEQEIVKPVKPHPDNVCILFSWRLTRISRKVQSSTLARLIPTTYQSFTSKWRPWQ